MRLLLIGTDRTIFTQGSAVRRRLSLFKGDSIEAIDHITFSLKSHGRGGAQELVPGVHAYPTNSFSRLLYGFDAWRIAKTLPRPDVIGAQDPFETGLIALVMARYWRVPLVVEIHTDFLSPSFARQSILNRLRLCIAPWVFKRASAVNAVAEKLKKEIISRYKLSIPFTVLPIYINLTRFRSLVRTPQKDNMLWIGRFEREKNPMLALRAFAAARQVHTTARLTMLGAGSLLGSLRSASARLGIGAFVDFPGWQDPARYLPNTELMLATSRYEGYGMAIVEALAAGVPVLSTDVGMARDAGAVIAEGSYPSALKQWLAGRREPAILKLHSYANEEEYFAGLRSLYAGVAKQS